MMEIILHRVNTLDALEKVPEGCGAEVDIRTCGSRLVLNHEAMQDGALLEEWLGRYRTGGTLILNPKEDGLEDRIIRLVEGRGIENYFFLDLTTPAMVRMMRRGNPRFAVRYSEYEPAAACMKFAGAARWCWVDCFSRYPMDAEEWALLAVKFRMCVCAPELEGHDPSAAGPMYLDFARDFPAHAVCTDFPDEWKRR
jgi:hypothetical protein